MLTGNGFYSVPEHTPLIFNECSGTGRTLFRLLVSDASGENEGYLLPEIVPLWVVDVTVKVRKEEVIVGTKCELLWAKLEVYSSLMLVTGDKQVRISASNQEQASDLQTPVAQRVDNALQWLNLCPLDSDLSGG